jgi:hypothetical protein
VKRLLVDAESRILDGLERLSNRERKRHPHSERLDMLGSTVVADSVRVDWGKPLKPSSPVESPTCRRWLSRTQLRQNERFTVREG